MPSTWLRWGMDGDGDGVSDPWNPEDAIFSAARYLAAAGGATDLPRAIFAYNHAQWYVDEVLAGARLYGSGDGAVGFTAAQPSVEVETAEAAVADAEDQLAEARRVERRLARRAARLVARADGIELLSRRLDAERDAAQAGFLRADAAAEVERLATELTDAKRALEQARAGRPERVRLPGHGRARAVVRGRVRLPGRRRPGRDLGLALPSRLSGRGHRRPAGRAAVRAHGRLRRRRLAAGQRQLRHRLHAPGGRRPRLDVLPPVLPRPGGRARRRTGRGRLGRPRRLDRPLDRSAPAPPAAAGHELPAGRAVVPGARRHRVQLAGRPGRAERAGLRGRAGERLRGVLPSRLLSRARVLPKD